MKIRKGFVSNSSSSSFIIIAPKALPLNEENISEFVSQGILTYEGYNGDVYERSEVEKEVLKIFNESPVENIVNLLKDANYNDATIIEFLVKNHSCIFYTAEVCDNDSSRDADFEHRILPYVADVVISHH